MDAKEMLTKVKEVLNLKDEPKEEKMEDTTKLSDLEKANADLTAQLEEANKKLVDLAEEKATEEKVEVVEEVKEELKEEVENTDLDALKTELAEMKTQLEELSKQPVREVELSDENLSFAEINMRQDKLRNENK